ncbi:MAG: OmpA family protein [Acidobacteriaceae bacterium]|nr:OmpA family protein [Acidobacteriaceae bacterium]
MPDSYFSSLSNAFPSTAFGSIAGHFGASEQTVTGGIQSSIAAIVNGMSQRSNDRGFISQIVQLASSTPENAVSSALSSDVLTNPNSYSLSGSHQLLNSIFGGRLGSLTDAISTQTGLRSAASSVLMGLGGTTVLSMIGRKLHDGSLNANNLPGFLQQESYALQRYVPMGFANIPAPGAPTYAATPPYRDVNPVVAQSVQYERHHSVWPWLLPLLLAALLLGIWAARPRRRPSVVVVTPQTPAAAPAPAVMASNGADLGTMVSTKACDGSDLRTPERGVEGRLLGFIEDTSRQPDRTSWFDFDRLRFDTDAATLQAQSNEQLQNIAAILRACPGVRLTIGGYTDNTGTHAHNMRLSQDRANSVVGQLETMGIADRRLRARGYGEQFPIGDNSTPDGRARNRRISMLVTSK